MARTGHRWKCVLKVEQNDWRSMSAGLDWVGFNVSMHQHNIGYPGDSFRSKDPTNSIKVYWRKSWPAIAWKRLITHQALPTVYKWTSKKRKTLSQWVQPSETKPHTAGWPVQVLYRTIDCASIDATQHFSKTGLGILYPLCTKPTSMIRAGLTYCGALSSWQSRCPPWGCGLGGRP